MGLVEGVDYSLEISVYALGGVHVLDKTYQVAVFDNNTDFSTLLSLPQRALIAIYDIKLSLYDRFPGLADEDALLSRYSWVEKDWAGSLKAQLAADCEYRTRISPSFVDARPVLCTHEPTSDWISRHLHDFGTYYTIQDLDALCGSGLVECVRGRTFVDVGAAIGHLTILAASLGMSAHAVEPIEPNLHLLQQSVRVNGLGDRIFLHHKALLSPHTCGPGCRQTLTSVPGNSASVTIDTLFTGNLGVIRPGAEGKGERGGGHTSSVDVMTASSLVSEIIAAEEDTAHVELLSLYCLGCEYSALSSLGKGGELGRVDGVLLFIFFKSMFRCTQRHWESVEAIRLLSRAGFCFYDLVDVRAAVAAESETRQARREAAGGGSSEHRRGGLAGKIRPIVDMETWQDDLMWDRTSHGANLFVFASRRHCPENEPTSRF